jgi:hypothetical protein
MIFFPEEERQTDTIPSDSARRPPGGAIRQCILTLLSQHGEGLSAEEIRVHLKAETPIGETLQGMRKAGIIKTHGRGKAMRYVVV